MTKSYFHGETLDDLMRSVVEEIQAHGDLIKPTKGAASELTGVLLELTDPRARISRTETRGKPFSCLGEFCWYLAKTNDLSFIAYYIQAYQQFADGDEIFCGYGPRLFDWDGINQVRNVISLLKMNPTSRKAVIQLFDRRDIVGDHNDVACTCTLQFMIRHNALHMFTNMRSNDVILGLPHDVFCFTMLQEVIARDLSIELGTYKHAVGSLHIYETDVDTTRQFLDEGWQSTITSMPPMPNGDPWDGIASLLKAEIAIRTGDVFDASRFDAIDPYWADLIRLLQVYRCKKDKNPDLIKVLREGMASDVYHPFIDKVLSQFL